jgi:dCTP deaminase
MTIKNDKWIKQMALENNLIEPYTDELKSDGIISYGPSSYGYDIRLADKFKIFTNVNNTIVDPKNFDKNAFVEFEGDVCIIPPNSFALAQSLEYIKMPRNVTGLVLGKSTYARCGIVANFTPLEAAWEGHITIEISNTTPLPARIYANEGFAQILFFEGEPCQTSYAERGGKYQGQKGITLPKVEGGEKLPTFVDVSDVMGEVSKLSQILRQDNEQAIDDHPLSLSDVQYDKLKKLLEKDDEKWSGKHIKIKGKSNDNYNFDTDCEGYLLISNERKGEISANIFFNDKKWGERQVLSVNFTKNNLALYHEGLSLVDGDGHILVHVINKELIKEFIVEQYERHLNQRLVDSSNKNSNIKAVVLKPLDLTVSHSEKYNKLRGLFESDTEKIESGASDLDVKFIFSEAIKVQGQSHNPNFYIDCYGHFELCLENYSNEFSVYITLKSISDKFRTVAKFQFGEGEDRIYYERMFLFDGDELIGLSHRNKEAIKDFIIREYEKHLKARGK